MNNKLLLAFTALTITFAFTTCYYDSEEELYPGNNCDTSNVTFSQTVQPILSQHCNTCHNTSVNNGGVITDNYNDLMNPVNSGVFWKAINHEGNGIVPMPFNGQKLPECDLQKIRVWIDQGAPNN